MTINLTLDYTEELLRQAVADRGEDFVYEKPDGSNQCMYVHSDGPGCIVGYVLHAAGVSLEALSEHEGTYASNLIYYLLGEEIIDSADREATGLLDDIQDRQDAGVPWGDAVGRSLH